MLDDSFKDHLEKIKWDEFYNRIKVGYDNYINSPQNKSYLAKLDIRLPEQTTFTYASTTANQIYSYCKNETKYPIEDSTYYQRNISDFESLPAHREMENIIICFLQNEKELNSNLKCLFETVTRDIRLDLDNVNISQLFLSLRTVSEKIYGHIIVKTIKQAPNGIKGYEKLESYLAHNSRFNSFSASDFFYLHDELSNIGKLNKTIETKSAFGIYIKFLNIITRLISSYKSCTAQ